MVVNVQENFNVKYNVHMHFLNTTIRVRACKIISHEALNQYYNFIQAPPYILLL